MAGTSMLRVPFLPRTVTDEARCAPGIIGIYGLIVGVVILGTIVPPSEGEYPAWRGYIHLGAGLATGLSGIAAGLSLGVIGEHGTRAYGAQSRLFTPMVLCLIFSEALAIYGTIIGLVAATKVT